MRRQISTWLLLGSFALLAGCGQKGALVLPTRPNTSAPASTTSVAKPAAPAPFAPASSG